MKVLAALFALLFATSAQAATHEIMFMMRFEWGEIGPVQNESETKDYGYIDVLPGGDPYNFKVGFGLDKTVDGQDYLGRIVIDDSDTGRPVYCRIAGVDCRYAFDVFEDRPSYTSFHLGTVSLFGYEIGIPKDGSGNYLGDGRLRVYNDVVVYGTDPVTGEVIYSSGGWLYQYKLTLIPAVPLPATSLTLMAGVGLLVAAGRRRKRVILGS
ncbi:VPLPA-CTERM sorting domain-containing protein [Seohaeicola zhoushanensis]|uniref:VPLPA-CTERM protein sorting domain-containing protein n=1 Tax=Seohaeicola zhoushanensis TaxID=1569283 RepID=A0A8J3GTQ8_9RHOB|nr:VPLPA-CTERM sorting domain-containing protein [Seohaeicola zhoushanensis]GHF33442.1 hypothetical protein GCM10017056_01070 [Seohaeicola zhoushanensis]